MAPEERALSPRSQHGDLVKLFQEPLWAEVYIACCSDTGETPQLDKARGFRDAVAAQNPSPRSERLSLRCLRIGAVATSCLASRLRDRKYTWVDLSFNQLGDHAMLSVRSLISALPCLRWLGLTGNLITAEGAKELAEELEANEVLENLVLGSEESGPAGWGSRTNELGTEGLAAVLGALQRNPRSALTSLTLCRTSITAEAVAQLVPALGQLEARVQQLHLSFNPLSSEGVCALLPHCNRLRTLGLADTGCRGELIHAPLCAVLRRTASLSSLSLAQNPLEPRPLRRIARAAANCASLSSLNLECTTLDAEGVTALCDALLGAPEQALTELDLSDNQLTQGEAASALAHLVVRSQLRTLRLNRNLLGDAGVHELGNALNPKLCPDSQLRCLELGSCRVGMAGATHLLVCLTHNKCLRTLCLADNYLDETLDLGLLEQLEYLQDLQLSGNRLPYVTMQKAAQVSERNRQRERDREPLALRAEMLRLLPAETRLGHARRQAQEDETELTERRGLAERSEQELKALHSATADRKRQLAQQLARAELELEMRRQELTEKSQELDTTELHYERLQQGLRQQLLEREQELVDVQVECSQLEDMLRRRKIEHPRQVLALTARIAAAEQETEELHASADNLRQRLKALQDKSLIDFRP